MAMLNARWEGSHMSWQDELQRLDTALAAGQISADQYRLQRDRLLAAAAGQQPAQPPAVQQPPQAQPPAEPPPAENPAEPPAKAESGRVPFPEAFRWTAAGNDSTQVMRPVPGPNDGAADQTQVVPGRSGDGERTQVVPSVDQSGDATQVVRGAGPEFRGTPQQQGGWHTTPPQGQSQGQPADFGLPWGTGELGPAANIPSWIKQGPEVFADRGGRGRRVAIIVAIVVVLVGGGLTAYLIATANHGQASTQPPAGPTTTSPKPPPGPKLPKGPFITLPGREVLNTSMSIDAAVAASVPTQQEATILHDDGIKSVAALITDDNGLHRGLWAFTPSAGGNATAALTAIDQFYTSSGYQPVTNAPAGTHELMLAGNGSTPTTYRAHYLTTTGVFVRIEAYGLDATVAKQAFDTLLNRELTKYPAAS